MVLMADFLSWIQGEPIEEGQLDAGSSRSDERSYVEFSIRSHGRRVISVPSRQRRKQLDSQQPHGGIERSETSASQHRATARRFGRQQRHDHRFDKHVAGFARIQSVGWNI